MPDTLHTAPASAPLDATNHPQKQPTSAKSGACETPARLAPQQVRVHPTVGILAVQGAFVEHESKLESLGAHCIELRCAEDVARPFDALVLPGGESTVQGKLMRELGMEAPLRTLIRDGIPVLATCAGMILLAQSIESESTSWLGTIHMTVRRNAYGRQLGSFHCEGTITGLDPKAFTAPFTFIRAPFVTTTEPGVEVLAKVNNAIVAVRYDNQIALAFHPELDESDQIHQAFLDLIT